MNNLHPIRFAILLATLTVTVTVWDGNNVAQSGQTIETASSVEARITPLTAVVMAQEPVEFAADSSVGKIKDYQWEVDREGSAPISIQAAGQNGSGRRMRHAFDEPGIYQVRLKVSDGTQSDTCSLLVRVHTEETRGLPQVLLDTDAKNEVDDQQYIAYALYSGLDVLGINSIHHGGGQEPMNRKEIHKLVGLASQSGLPAERKPFVFRGADERLQEPESGQWSKTIPMRSDASEAILAAARGASPDNPVWVLPVGPCTNVASAVLQARAEGLDLAHRIRVIWLGGGPTSASKETFNGRNDPWSVYVIGQSGVEFWILLENPTGASLRYDKRTDPQLYPKNVLGEYLKTILDDYLKKHSLGPAQKALYDLATVSVVIADHLKLDWMTQVEPTKVLGPTDEYRWEKVTEPTCVHIIRDMDEEAMKKDFLNTLSGKPARLR